MHFQHNNRVEAVDLEENGLGPEGGAYIASMLRDNHCVTHMVSHRQPLHYTHGESVDNHCITHMVSQ